MKGIFLILAAGWSLFAYGSISAADFFSLESGMYDDKNFSLEKSRFTPYDTIYIVLNFRDLAPGEYTVTADWLTPYGNLERQAIHSFMVAKKEPLFRIYFWLQLQKKGPVKRSLTGTDYKEEFYGKWEVHCYMKGQEIEQRTFEVF